MEEEYITSAVSWRGAEVSLPKGAEGAQVVGAEVVGAEVSYPPK